MAYVHGKNTIITVDGDTVKANASSITRTRDSHDVTGYGDDAHTFSPGLGNGTFTMSGVYDSTASTGSRAILQPLADDPDPAAIEVTRKPEGTGSGKPLETFDAVLTSYAESDPVSDMVTWQADFQISGGVVTTAQGA